MTAAPPIGSIRGVMPVIPCRDLSATLEFFRQTLGFRLDLISPADSPSTAVLSGHGAQVRLQRVDDDRDPGVLQLLVGDPSAFGASELTAPNGTVVQVLPAERDVEVPPVRQSLVVSHIADSEGFGVGRAGMQYRDLVPDRQGGRFIASHILISDGGPVPDYVHYHRIRFQLIFVRRGWVTVVYEDQGEPFVMQAGDCVLQPPTIRHRVLEASDGMEVVEIACPAEHDTIPEHVIELPTGLTLPDREYGGQHFVRHIASEAPWVPFRFEGFVQQDLGIGAATHGLAGARVVRADGASSWPTCVVDNEFLLTFVLDGSATLVTGGTSRRLESGDCCVIPADQPYALTGISADAALLEVSLPADLEPRRLEV